MITNINMSSVLKNSCSPFYNFMNEHHHAMVKRDVPLASDDAELNAKTKVDNYTVISAFRDFFKAHHSAITKRGTVTLAPSNGTFVENGATKRKENGVIIVETSEKIQDA